MRQPHPELNFRRGRAMQINALDVVAVWYWMHDGGHCDYFRAMGARTL